MEWITSKRTAPGQNLQWSTATQVLPSVPVLFDFDSDGEPEVVVIVDSVETSEAGLSFHVRRGRVWTIRAGTLGLYPPARDFVVEDARDIDGDGRLDLITHAPYAALAKLKCGSEEPCPVSGPALLPATTRRSCGSGSRSLHRLASPAERRLPGMAAPTVRHGLKRPNQRFRGNVRAHEKMRSTACRPSIAPVGQTIAGLPCRAGGGVDGHPAAVQ